MSEFRQSDTDSKPFVFELNSSQLDDEQEFLVEAIDELVETIPEEPKTANVYEYLNPSEPNCPSQSETDEELVAENQQLKAKIAEFEQFVTQLEISNQTIQSQQVMIDTLSHQLVETQAQLSSLERECTEVQEKYNQQVYKLLETEKQLQELHRRLLRQQRYTLEYKNALEDFFKDTTAAVTLANESLLKQTSVKPTSAESPETEASQAKNPKSHWPSPGIESESLINPKKPKKSIDLPTFIK